jgi:hypothetical protein
MTVNIRNKMSMLLTIAAVAGFVSAGPAHAGFNQGESVTFRGEPMFAITGDAGGFTAQKRAWQAQDNFDNALVRSADKSPSAVAVVRENGANVLKLGGFYITTADAQSAAEAGMSSEALANSWAGSIKACLSREADVSAYVDSLKQNHPLKAGVEIVEKDIMVADYNQIPFRLAEGTLAVNKSDPFQVVAVLDRDVVLEGYSLPARTTMEGTIRNFRNNKDRFISFEKAYLPDGGVLVLKDVVAATCIATEAPKLVLSECIPADPKSESREPAFIGIGARKAEVAVLQARPDLVAAYRIDIEM